MIRNVRKKQIGDTINKVVERKTMEKLACCTLVCHTFNHIYVHCETLIVLFLFITSYRSPSSRSLFHTQTHTYTLSFLYIFRWFISQSLAISSSASICYCQFHTSILSTLKSFSIHVRTAFNTYYYLVILQCDYEPHGMCGCLYTYI